jgi:capsular exopolysaccharide synthesis family protein
MNPVARDMNPVTRSDGFTGAVRVLRERWLLVVGVIVICVAVAAYRHERGAKSYTATASVVFQSGTLSESALQVQPSTSPEPVREADTEVLVAHSPEVAEGVRKLLRSRLTTSDLLEAVKVEADPDANVLSLVASTGSPAQSARLANAFAEEYIAFRARSELADVEAAQSSLQRQIEALPAGSSERANLEPSLQRLSELRAVAGGGASIIGRATPPGSPSGSSLSTTLVVGLLIGVALACSLVFLVEALDHRIKTIEEFEGEYRLPALTAVTQSAFRFQHASERGALLEPYRILRGALDFVAVTRTLDTLMVTSAIPGEGKTTVSIDLAHAVALTGRSVALIELDLRRPSFAEQFRLDTHEGLSTALTRGAPLSELMLTPLPELANLAVLPAGRLPHNPSEILGSERITEIIESLRESYDMVIIDAPPLNPVADAQVLIANPVVHASIIVARVNKTSRDDARRARAILDRQAVEPVGIVVTGLRETGSYGYGYGYEQSPGREHEAPANPHVTKRASTKAEPSSVSSRASSG